MTVEGSGAQDRDMIYDQAKNKFLHYASAEDLNEAVALFRQVIDHKSAAQYIEKCETLLAFMVGNDVTMGSFEGRPIQWKVVDQRGKMRLLLAKDIVTRRPYHYMVEDAFWQSCTLRKWLNDEFLKTAFDRREQLRIVPCKVQNLRNRKWYSNGGMDTMDKVHIPSMEEIEKYMPDQAERAGSGWWWLRGPGSNTFSAVAVYDDGSIYDIGIHIDYEKGGVRPAVWVLLKV